MTVPVRTWIIVLLCLLFQFPTGTNSGNINYEKKIRDALFHGQQDIETHTRPVKSRNNTVTVQIQMYLKHILELDQINETFSAQIILRLEWYDGRLSWNPAQFGDVTRIYISKDLIWLPDLTLYNEMQEHGDIFDNNLLMIHSSGKVTWTSSIPTVVPCAVDLQHYPFDEHRCNIRLGSWTHHGYHISPELKSSNPLEEMNEKRPGPSRATFQDHNLWEVTHAIVAIEQRIYSCCAEPYPSAVMYITVARKTPHFLMTLVLPACISILILFAMFCFSPMSGEKIGIGCFALLYILLLDIYAYWTIPRNGSSIPNIVILIGSLLILAGILLLVSVFMVTMTRTKHQSGIPLLLKNILSGFPRKLLCLSYQNQGISDAAMSMVETDPWSHNKIGKQHEWVILAKAIDRLFLILYIVITIILLPTLLRTSRATMHPFVAYNTTSV